jgi:hypothetical protein
VKISFNFDHHRRAITLEPENELEIALLVEMEAGSAKGTTIEIKSVKSEPGGTFEIVMRMNGK